jgi:hypothetical protein
MARGHQFQTECINASGHRDLDESALRNVEHIREKFETYGAPLFDSSMSPPLKCYPKRFRTVLDGGKKNEVMGNCSNSTNLADPREGLRRDQ